MTLRRKLLTIFIALAIMSLLSAGLTIWSTFSQHRLLEKLDDHYVESLTLHRISSTSATLFRRYALSRVSDQPDGFKRLTELDSEVRDALLEWQAVAHTPKAVERWQRVKESYARLAREIVKPTPRPVHPDNMPQVSQETTDAIRGFRDLLVSSLEANEQTRRNVQGRLAELRQTVQLASTLSAFSTFCLVLLLIAYVGSDIFAPLRELERALRQVARGASKERLEGDRDDELGAINRAFNELAESLDVLRSEYRVVAGANAEGGSHPPSRGIEALRDQLRERGAELRSQLEAGAAGDSGAELLGKLEALCEAVESMAALYFPVELETSETSVNALLYDVLAEFSPELSRRGVSLTVVAPAGDPFVEIDRERVREALRVLVRAALGPAQSVTHLELKGAFSEGADPRLLLEVIDVVSSESIAPLHEGASRDLRRLSLAGVALARDVAERHGGSLHVELTSPGTFRAVMELPIKKGRQARSRRLLAG